MVLIGASDLAASALSSSAMPFLKAFIPLATSPIMSEILLRPPNTSSSTTPTINQCQMLKEPIKSSVGHNARWRARPWPDADFSQKLGVGTGKNKRDGTAVKPQVNAQSAQFTRQDRR